MVVTGSEEASEASSCARYSKPDRSRTPQKAAPPHVVAEQRAPHEKTGLDSEQRRARDGLDLLVPLLYAPALPLMRIVGRGRVPPERLNAMMMGTIGLALTHAGYIMFSDSTVLHKYEGE